MSERSLTDALSEEDKEKLEDMIQESERSKTKYGDKL